MPARRAGQYAREMTRRKARLALLALATMVAAAGLALLVGGFSWSGVIAVELLLLAGLVVLDRLVVPVVERWGRGAAGEEHVGQLLAELENDGNLAIHDVETGCGNIDTVLVGPAGLFTIEVKSHRGRIRSDGIDPAWLRQAYAQRMWLERVAGRPTTALLVLSRAYIVGRAVSRQRGVVVLPARMLAGHLSRSRQLLSLEEARQVHHRLLHALSKRTRRPGTHRQLADLCPRCQGPIPIDVERPTGNTVYCPHCDALLVRSGDEWMEIEPTP